MAAAIRTQRAQSQCRTGPAATSGQPKANSEGYHYVEEACYDLCGRLAVLDHVISAGHGLSALGAGVESAMERNLRWWVSFIAAAAVPDEAKIASPEGEAARLVRRSPKGEGGSAGEGD